MTAIVKGRVLDYSGRPVEASVTFAPTGAPAAISDTSILTAGVCVRTSRTGSVCAQLSAGEYVVTLHASVCISATVSLNSGEEYGLARLLGVTGDEGYSIIVSDDGDTMTIPPSYLVDESGDAYQLGSVLAYTVQGTDAHIEEAIGTKVEDIASARIEELVKAEVEESAGPIIEASVAEEVQPLRGDLTTLSAEVTTVESQVSTLTGRVTELEGEVADVEDELDAQRTKVTALQGTVNANSGDIASVAARTTALETWKGSADARIAAVEAREDKDTVYDDTALAARVTALEAREDKDTVYDDAELRSASQQMAADIAGLEDRVADLEENGGGGGGGTVEEYDDTELRGLISANTTRIDALEVSDAQQDQDLEVIAASVSANGRDIAQLRTDVDAASSAASQAATDAADALSGSSAANAAVSELSGRVDSVEDSVASNFARIDSLESTVSGLGASVTAVEEKSASNESRIGVLEGQMATAVVSILKLGADEEIPADTPAGTLVVRVAE